MLTTFGNILLLTTIVTIVKTQDDCECKLYFFCSGNSTESSKCPDEYDICCFSDGNSSSSTTESIIVEPQPQSPSIVTEGPDVVKNEEGLCGIRGSLLPRGPSSSGPTSSGPTLTGPTDSAPPAAANPDLGSIVDFKVFDDLGGDTSTMYGEFPWMVAVMKKSSASQEFLCGGSIIYPRIILTTAHSIRDFSAQDLVVKAGVWDSTDPNEAEKHQDRAVSEIILHPGFDQQKVENDIAILVLEQPLTFTNNVGTICLPSTDLPINTSSCMATGWGAENFGAPKKMASILKKVDLPLVNYDTCQNRLRQVPKLGSNFNLHNSFICAGGDKVDTCSGDGGGPLMCATLQDRNRYVQVGVTSWGVGCGQGPPGVYASVQAAVDFIENTHAGVLLTDSFNIKTDKSKS